MAGGGSTSQGTGQTMSQPTPSQGNPNNTRGFINSAAQNMIGGVFNSLRQNNTQSVAAPQPAAPTYPTPPAAMPGDISGLVNNAYSQILGRQADAPGTEYWQGQMANNNLSGQGLISGLVNSPEFQRRQQYEQAYTQQFRPGPTGRPFNPNPTPVPTTGPQGQALTTVDGKQGYYRSATADEIRRGSQQYSGYPGFYGNNMGSPVEGYDARTRQVFVPYTPSVPQTTQSQQFFQPIYLSRYQNYATQGMQGPFGGQMNPYGGFNPFMGFGGGGMYAYSEGGDVNTGIAGLLND